MPFQHSRYELPLDIRSRYLQGESRQNREPSLNAVRIEPMRDCTWVREPLSNVERALRSDTNRVKVVCIRVPFINLSDSSEVSYGPH